MWNDLKSFVQRCHARALTFELSELKREGGQAMVEYGLILALVSIAAIAVLGNIGLNLTTIFTEIETAL